MNTFCSYLKTYLIFRFKSLNWNIDVFIKKICDSPLMGTQALLWISCSPLNILLFCSSLLLQRRKTKNLDQAVVIKDILFACKPFFPNNLERLWHFNDLHHSSLRVNHRRHCNLQQFFQNLRQPPLMHQIKHIFYSILYLRKLQTETETFSSSQFKKNFLP